MEKVKVTNMVKFYALALLYEKPRHGYEIIKNLSNSLKKKLAQGRFILFWSCLIKIIIFHLRLKNQEAKKLII